ncbi:hypothetical protein ACUIJQ_11955 [Levilactobacillus hammesii]|uniref:Uncharacterized protein n=1 Tax=Levilactobacillus hammesii DSM 16381 TaxID=1423753 RepID=A0A0R1UKF8_9LACO|nr:hypothetical protein [Levilactobacillus hammesii]KRL93791.1 hypothetical protein FD28_GL000978 [Levilactobacillus hammesii DSM 16381]
MSRNHIIYQANITDKGEPQITFTPDTPNYADVDTFRDLLMLTLQATQDVLHLSDADFEAMVNDALAEAQARRQEHLLKPTDTVKLITKDLDSNQREEFLVAVRDLQDITNDDDVLTITTRDFSFSFIDNDTYKQIKKNIPADAVDQIPTALGIDHILYAYRANQEGVGQLIQYAQANDCYTDITSEDDEDVPDTPEEFEKFMEQEFGDLRATDDGSDNIIPFPKR